MQVHTGREKERECVLCLVLYISIVLLTLSLIRALHSPVSVSVSAPSPGLLRPHQESPPLAALDIQADEFRKSEPPMTALAAVDLRFRSGAVQFR